MVATAPRKKGRRRDLQELLDDLATNQYRLARASGCSRQYVSKVCAGERTPSPGLVIRWAKALRVGPGRIAKAVTESLRRGSIRAKA